MAGIGLYGVYYAKGTITDGVLTGYNGVQTMGKAISANFEPADAGGSNLWANNAIAETDGLASAGGTLTIGTDRISNQAYTDLFGLTSDTKTVTVGGETVTGTGFSYNGTETAAPVGVAFVRWRQEDNNRGIYEAVIYAYCTFNEPSEEMTTYDGDSGIEWQTPELEATVSGGVVTGTYPWRQKYTFDSQAAAIQFITDAFAA